MKLCVDSCEYCRRCTTQSFAAITVGKDVGKVSQRPLSLRGRNRHSMTAMMRKRSLPKRKPRRLLTLTMTMSELPMVSHNSPAEAYDLGCEPIIISFGNLPN